MKKGKWMRLGMGACLLVSILLLPGSTPVHEFDKCALFCLEEMSGLGYLEIYNNTIYNIVVEIRSKKASYGPFKIKSNPNFMRIDLPNGGYSVYAFVCTPTPDQEPVFYRRYPVSVPSSYETVTLKVTTPLGYIPIPK